MSYSVVELNCKSCNATFNAHKSGLLDVGKEYAATCPKCSKQTFFNGKGAFIVSAPSKNSVNVLNVAKL